MSLWNDTTSRWWELTLALAGLALLASLPRWRDRGLAAAGILAALTYFNFGSFHFGRYIHVWDVFHYYLGAKYFPELGYQRLYECVAVADAEDPALRPRVEARKITRLTTNELVSTDDILRHPERCTSHFSSQRWQAFRADLAWFRARESPPRWDEFSADHGFNGTPVWMLAGRPLADTGPASDRQIPLLTLLDPLYFFAMLAVAAWAFGWRGTAVALLVFATFLPCRFFWTGGSFLRWDWLFYTVSAVACLKRGRPFLGGLALGYAALLRIFPGLLLAGPLLGVLAHAGPKVAQSLASAKAEGRPVALGATVRGLLASEPTRSHLRFLAGFVVAAAVLAGASLAVAGGPGAYRGFLLTSKKHANTPLTNNMGLRMVLTFRPDEVGRKLHDDRAAEPWGAWKKAKLEAWRVARPIAVLLSLAFLALLYLGIRHHPEPWIAAALGSMFIPFATDLTSYYYAFVFVPALLWTRQARVGWLLLALSALSTFVSLAPFAGMSSWRDEQYSLVASATLVAFVAIAIDFAFRTPPTPDGLEVSAPLLPP